MLNTGKTILSLFDFTGNWCKPYRDAGYDVIQVDLKHGTDVRMIQIPQQPIHGILAAPPCTDFAGSGARWWATKGDKAIIDGLSMVDAVMRLVVVCKPEWWVLENPVGRLVRWIGPPRMIFNPCDYGDPYTKKTCLWGDFTEPLKAPVEPTEGSKMWALYGGKSERTKAARSETPMGFAKAFFAANP